MKKYIKSLCVLCVIVLLVMTLLYFAKMKSRVDVNFESVNDIARTGTLSQGNCIVLCEDNGVFDFPFVFGGKAYLFSIPDGRKYYIEDNLGFLNGIAEPCISGNLLLWFEAWDGSNQGKVHITNINDKQTKYQYPEYIYTDQYLLCNSDLYVLMEEEASHQKQIVKYELDTGDKQIVADNAGSYFTILKDKLYCYDETSCRLYKVDGSEKEEYRIDGYMTMNLRNDQLYYFDDEQNVYYIDDVDNAKPVLLLDVNKELKNQTSLGDFEKISKKVIWCDDYIAILACCDVNGSYRQYLTVFDYEGNMVLCQQNNRLSF